MFQLHNESAVAASFKVSYMIAKAKKPHTIAEELIVPCCEVLVKHMIGEPQAKMIREVSLSNTTVQRRIVEISDNIESQLTTAVQHSPVFAIQLDESCDISSLSELMCFVRYIENGDLQTNFVFCKSLETTTRARDVMEHVEQYMSNHNMSLSSLSYCTTDGAPAMMGKRNGFISLLEAGAPKCIGIHCNLHRQVLSSKFLPEDLNDVFKDVIEIINFVKSSATNIRLFMKLCKDEEAEYQRLIYYTAVKWLSRGNAFSRVFELRLQVGEFIDSKNHRLAEPFMAYACVSTMAYQCQPFSTRARYKHL